MRHGIHVHLEEQANRIIRESLVGVTRHSEKSDILTPWKEQERRRREVFNTAGVADAAVRQGIFHRASNPARPELNSRDGAARPRSIGTSLSAHIQRDYSGRSFDE